MPDATPAARPGTPRPSATPGTRLAPPPARPPGTPPARHEQEHDPADLVVGPVHAPPAVGDRALQRVADAAAGRTWWTRRPEESPRRAPPSRRSWGWRATTAPGARPTGAASSRATIPS